LFRFGEWAFLDWSTCVGHEPSDLSIAFRNSRRVLLNKNKEASNTPLAFDQRCGGGHDIEAARETSTLSFLGSAAPLDFTMHLCFLRSRRG
jgi:hypothetical protein